MSGTTIPLAHYQQEIKKTLGFLIPKNSEVAIFDFPNYSNVGDSAIWLGTILLLRKEFNVKIKVIEDFNVVHRGLPKLNIDILVLINGGGNFGDLWIESQILREQIILNYPNNRIIQLPQSIYFNNEDNFDASKLIFEKHKDFHLLARDNKSLSIAKELCNCPTYLCPDMALCLGLLARPSKPIYPIFALLRDDPERLIPCLPTNITDILAIDWIDEPNSMRRSITDKFQQFQSSHPKSLNRLKLFLYNQLAKERLLRGLALLSQGEVVITDRLHGHILCYLMKIPHVVLDNSYGKISSFRFAWNTGGDLCQDAVNMEDAIIKAKNFLK